MNKEEAKQFLIERMRQKPIQKAQSIEDPARLAISIFNKHIKNKMLFPASGHFQTPNQAKMWFADQAGKFGMEDLKQEALKAKSYDDIQKLGQIVVEDSKLTDKIINGIALGITDKKNAREWNPVEKPPNLVFRGRVTDQPRDIEGELKDRGQWESRGGGSAQFGYGQGPVGVGPNQQGGGEGPTAGGAAQQPQGPTEPPSGGEEPQQQASLQEGQGEDGEMVQGAMSQAPDPSVEEAKNQEIVKNIKRYFPRRKVIPRYADPNPEPMARDEGERPIYDMLPSWLKKNIFKDGI